MESHVQHKSASSDIGATQTPTKRKKEKKKK
jgi:hypothetical protein